MASLKRNLAVLLAVCMVVMNIAPAYADARFVVSNTEEYKSVGILGSRETEKQEEKKPEEKEKKPEEKKEKEKKKEEREQKPEEKEKDKKEERKEEDKKKVSAPLSINPDEDSIVDPLSNNNQTFNESSQPGSIFTGNVDNPVSNGTWSYDAGTDTWSYASTQPFNSTWGYVANPWNDNKPAWFYFDENGKMLTGWNLIYWNDAYKWFYFTEVSNGHRGELYVNTTTPDGYRVNEDGVYTVNGSVQRYTVQRVSSADTSADSNQAVNMQSDGIGTSIGVIIGIVIPTDLDAQGSLQVKKGEVVTIQGPNGAGKSTTIRILGAPAIQELGLSDGLSGEDRQKGVIGTVYVEPLKKYPQGGEKQLTDSNTTPMQALKGKVAGVQISSDGQPDADPSIRIRGIGSFGSTAPLYVID